MSGTRFPRWTPPAGTGETGFGRVEISVTADERLLRAAHIKVLAELTSERALIAGITEPEQLADVTPTLFTDPEQPEIALVIEDSGRAALRYRRDVMTAEYAQRLVSYHVEALKSSESVVTERDARWQREALSGPRIPLGDKMFVELFEALAEDEPDRVAAVHNDQVWTYSDLNARANAVAHSLLEQGLRPEEVVVVCLPRNLDWIAAMLGIFKAGGVYLPVRPDFPPDRVAVQVEQSRCRLAISDSASMGPLPFEPLYVEGSDPRNPGVHIGPDQLAYIYFTSGSTGTPKGAMCEHAGMLNHLWTKVGDMSLKPGQAVTQTASQCFDISLWQVIAPLLIGGHTVIIDTETQMDVMRFVETVASGGIEVIQIVPSYLDVMLSHLAAHPGPLGDLHTISVTGEALKTDLVRRWFALYPDITLVNAYGATEVSDDTMHTVLRAAPEWGLPIVPVGPSLRNVNTYIVDEQLRIVPLGAAGEIAFSGVCVGRGYINDPERTAAAFTSDPFLPNTRLYRTGDFGRWLPDGTIEFLGRRDEQVKIRGFRIEIGEIESKLLKMPGVREAAVTTIGESDGRKLIAFFTALSDVEPADLRDLLAAAVPEYMVPAYFHRLDALPLNENGKVNKKLLRDIAGSLVITEYIPPSTDTERRLATAWAEVLNILVGRIGRADDFFQLGGTSLAAVRLVVKLDRLISLRQLAAHPVLSDLAALIDGDSSRSTGLLQKLSGAADAKARLICFPYAGGNAINFQRVAAEMSELDVYAVEFPGHDVARPSEALESVEAIAKRVVDEIADGPEVILWGHCAGAAYALEVARLLEADGRPPARLLIGALMFDEPAALEQETAQVTAMTPGEITQWLHSDSAYIELDLLRSERAHVVGRAYKHDVCTANGYLAQIAYRLQTPLEVVVASDDPTTEGFQTRAQRWRRISDSVTVHEIGEGGHYFIRTRAADVALLVRRC